MKRGLALVLRQLKRRLVVGLAGPSGHQRHAVVSLALVALSELALLVLTFCTNFLSAYVHNTAEAFRGFRLRSLANAQRIVAFERATGLFFEQPLQRWHDTHFGGWRFWNTYYAGVHPVVTVVFLVFILVRMFAWKLVRVNWKRLNEGSAAYAPEFDRAAPRTPARVAFGELTPAQQYRFLRAVWVLGAWLAFLGFLLVPVMPPRLLPVCDFFNAAGANVGACLTSEYAFIDTIGAHGSLLWDWNDESVKTLNNPYAAFPSQHTLFAAWCAVTWILLVGPAPPALPRRSARYSLRALLRWGIVAYPLVTVYCIVITANHYIADALGGLVALAVSYIAVHCYHLLRARRAAGDHELLPSCHSPRLQMADAYA
ncbi:hypothetical protein LPJ61_001060 [Coemansia biformis]|uniref:Inositolphosphotransferase Aur1/Ipt1 domain-containing protein n=1 Tax=Coemansia biformis TaxID=1286918 RepID=A0A9W8D0G3_9FUNG|nr:hypothetical protein LPJ61_001060 [Coemansia biformis]